MPQTIETAANSHHARAVIGEELISPMTAAAPRRLQSDRLQPPAAALILRARGGRPIWRSDIQRAGHIALQRGRDEVRERAGLERRDRLDVDDVARDPDADEV